MRNFEYLSLEWRKSEEPDQSTFRDVSQMETEWDWIFFPERLTFSLTRSQACKFVCMMPDMARSACLSCLSFYTLKRWSGVSLLHRLTEYLLKPDRRLGNDREVIICKLVKPVANYILKTRSFYRPHRTLHSLSDTRLKALWVERSSTTIIRKLYAQG